MKILITGAAGFIGFHLVKKLAENDNNIVCIDNINEYYDVELKYGRLKELGFNVTKLKKQEASAFTISTILPNTNFVKMDLCESERLTALFGNEKFDIILHIAAQAGVRYSLTNPHTYISSNIQGFLNLLEAAKLHPPRHLIYASSSSVYGLNTASPFSEKDAVNQPASLYAVTKRANELMAYTYSHLYKIPTTGLRFFTVYGPWGRPDMAPFIFTKSIIEGKTLNLFNNGNMKRDFTYIDDIIESILRIINLVHVKKPEHEVPTMIYNIGNGSPIQIIDFIHLLEEALGKKAIIQNAPMQDGDVISTCADCSSLEHDTGFKPSTLLSVGVQKFVDWYKDFYK